MWAHSQAFQGIGQIRKLRDIVVGDVSAYAIHGRRSVKACMLCAQGCGRNSHSALIPRSGRLVRIVRVVEDGQWQIKLRVVSYVDV